MNTLVKSKVNVWLCDALKACLQSGDAQLGRLVRAVLAGVS
jgi:hypothetical protein